MAVKPMGLGRGLDALIKASGEAHTSPGIQMLPLKDIVPNPKQPRRKFSQKALEELAASIRNQGLLQPLLVRPIGTPHSSSYEIVAGERRWRACQLIGLKEVPVLVRNFTAQDTLAAALIENLQREDLNPMEEAFALHTLKEEFGLSQESLAHKISKSRPAVANSLRLLTLPASIQTDIAEGKLSAGHARALLSISDKVAQEEARTLILTKELSVREAEALAVGWKEKGVLPPVDGAPDYRQNLLPRDNDNPKGIPQNSSSGSATTKSRPQSARILEIQNLVGALLQVPVKVTGKGNKGKISLSYASQEELGLLLQRLSCLALEQTVYEALPAQAHDMLPGITQASLSDTPRAKLAGADKAELTGNGHIGLVGAVRQELASSVKIGLQHNGRKELIGTDHVALAEKNTSRTAPGQSTKASLFTTRPGSASKHDTVVKPQ